MKRNPKIKNELQQEIIEFLESDNRFEYQWLMIGGNSFTTSNYNKESENCDFIELKLPFSGKTLAAVKIHLYNDWDYDEPKDAVKVKIEMYLNSYNMWETFFEGWIWTLDEFKFILKSLGIN